MVNAEFDGVDSCDVLFDPRKEGPLVPISAEADLRCIREHALEGPAGEGSWGTKQAVRLLVDGAFLLSGLVSELLGSPEYVLSRVVHAGAAFGGGVTFHGSTLFAEASYPGLEGSLAVAGFFKQAGHAVVDVSGAVSVDATPWITYVVALELGALKRGEPFVGGRH